MLTFDVFGALYRARVFRDREFKILAALGVHVSEEAGRDCECRTSYANLRMTSGIASKTTLSKGIKALEAMGILWVIRGRRQHASNTYRLNHVYLETMRRRFQDLRSELVDTVGYESWDAPYGEAVKEEMDRLYTRGVTHDELPRKWLSEYRVADPEALKTMFGDVEKGVKAEPRCPANGHLNGENSADREQSSGPISEPSCPISASSCPPRVDTKPKNQEPTRRASAAPERRQSPGEGKLDRPENVQVAFEVMTIHWMATGEWSPPSGYNGDVGPPPDDPNASIGFGLGPKRLFGLVTALITPLRTQNRHFIKGGASANRATALSKALRGSDGEEAALIRERMICVSRLRDAVTEANHRGVWSPPVLPGAEAA